MGAPWYWWVIDEDWLLMWQTVVCLWEVTLNMRGYYQSYWGWIQHSERRSDDEGLWKLLWGWWACWTNLSLLKTMRFLVTLWRADSGLCYEQRMETVESHHWRWVGLWIEKKQHESLISDRKERLEFGKSGKWLVSVRSPGFFCLFLCFFFCCWYLSQFQHLGGWRNKGWVNDFY